MCLVLPLSQGYVHQGHTDTFTYSHADPEDETSQEQPLGADSGHPRGLVNDVHEQLHVPIASLRVPFKQLRGGSRLHVPGDHESRHLGSHRPHGSNHPHSFNQPFQTEHKYVHQGVAQSNVVIGVAAGLKAEGVKLFLVSLRKFSQAHVFLYVDRVPDNMPKFTNVNFLIFHASELPSPWNRYHPSSYRYYLYHLFMQDIGKNYKKVQASDVRDVVFQADPFEIVEDDLEGVHVFEEDESMTIQKCPVNSKWIAACYGHAVGTTLGSKPISCSGYAIGTSSAMAQYFDVMAGELGARVHCEQNGIDQGVHNVLVNWKLASWRPAHGSLSQHNQPPQFFHYTLEQGPVYTGGYAPKGEYIRGVHGEFQNQDHVDYHVLHQYDRHASMVVALQERFLSGRTDEVQLH